MTRSLVLLFLAALTGCTTYPSTSATEASSQIASGTALAPTNDNPVVLGDRGLLMLYCAYRSGGCGNYDQFGQLGVSPDLVMNWIPADATYIFDFIEGEDGLPIYTVTFPYPSSFRGIAAEFDAVQVDWTTSDGSESAAEGQSDGYYGPLADSMDNVTTVYNCGHPSRNFLAAWDENGSPDYAKAALAANYGEDYGYAGEGCGDQ